MVNGGGGNSLSQGEFYSPKDYWTRNERQYMDLPPDTRFQIPGTHNYPQNIESALRDCAQIPVKEFALLVKLENGDEKIFSSVSLKPYRSRIFTDQVTQEFHHCCRLLASESSFAPALAYSSQENIYNEFSFESSHEFRKHLSIGDSSSELPHEYGSRQIKSDDSSDDLSGKKRRRTCYSSDEDTPMPAPQKYKHLLVGDEEEITKFYDTRFKDMQQSACKVIGKAFVKFIEPKKQTHHPYTGSAEKAPPWWPNMTGTDAVRHKEPDHLLKPERVRLLVHILRMVVEPPEKQHPSIQRLALDVKKLEEMTMEHMSVWFNDKDHSDNKEKRPYLKEIFKVARAQERYKNGEIDASTSIPIMHGERVPGQDSDSDENELTEDDERANIPLSSNVSTPESVISPSIMSGPHLQHLDSEGQNMGTQRGRSLYAGRQMQSGHAADDHLGYLESLRVGTYQAQGPSVPRTFTPGFPSPQQNIYSSNWQNNSLFSSTSMSSPSYCVPTSSQAVLALPATSYQLPAPHIQAQQNLLPPPGTPVLQHSYNDGLPNSRQYDSGPALGTQLRTGSLGHPHQIHQGNTFEGFLTDGGFGPNDPDLKEEHIRQS